MSINTSLNGHPYGWQLAITVDRFLNDFTGFALRFLFEQYNSGYGELKHLMFFPNQKGFEIEDEIQTGDVFQRALIADTYCDAEEVLGIDLTTPIQNEVKYIIDQRRRDRMGGWSYFPNLLELAPDADTLAQSIQLFIRSNSWINVKHYAQKAIDALLNDGVNPDGSLETWIIEQKSSNRIAQRQLYFAENFWGRGPDTDVIANMLYALDMTKDPCYSPIICRGTDYLLSQQKCDGTWESTWYHGPFYGTYVCVRLLTSLSHPQERVFKALKSACEGLSDLQCQDGGWGIKGDSDPLSTSLAILALTSFSKITFASSTKGINSGLNYLSKYWHDQNLWPKVDFIKMDLGRARQDVKRTLTYSSQTITANFVAKAGLKVASIQKQVRGD